MVFVAGISLLATGCGSGPASPPESPAPHSPAATASDAAPWRIGDHVETIRKASCLEGVSTKSKDEVVFSAYPLFEDDELASLGDSDGVRLDGATLVAAWDLVSKDKRFGGLSAVETVDGNDLLALTDVGSLVAFRLDEDTKPTSAFAWPLRDEGGKPLTGKLEGDSEGLVLLENNIALVSFEGHHRISAFDLGGCEATARQVLLAEFSSMQDGVPDLGRNGGPEALAIAPDGGLVIGVENLDDGRAPISVSPASGLYDFTTSLPPMGAMSLTGADIVAEEDGTATLYAVHRSFSIATGINIAVTKTKVMPSESGGWTLGETSRLIRMASPALADNFEGIAVTDTLEGRRLFLIADNNFSSRQKSLLFVFDLLSAP